MLRNGMLLSVFTLTFAVCQTNARMRLRSFPPAQGHESTSQGSASFDIAQDVAQSSHARPTPDLIRKWSWDPLCNGESCGPTGDTNINPGTEDNGSIAWNNLVGSLDTPQLATSTISAGGSGLANGGDNSLIEQSVPPPTGDPGVNNPPDNSAVYIPWSAATQDPNLENPVFNGLDPNLHTAEGGAIDIASVPQNQGDGRPIMDCTSPNDDQQDAYVVHEITFKGKTQPWRYPHAILVSDSILPYDIRYDVAPQGKRLVFRRVANFKFIGNDNKLIELSEIVRRGWLVGHDQDSKQAALDWFESIAKTARYLDAGLGQIPKKHYSKVWAARVLRALDDSHSPYWVPDPELK